MSARRLTTIPLATVAGREGWAPPPAPLTSLIGREREIGSLGARLRDPAVRLVTLTGPGGVGKTRIALHLATDLGNDDTFPDGVAFVELASVLDARLVAPTIAHALGLRYGGQDPVIVALAVFLRARRFLLVLDNFEQVIDAASDVAELLRACPNLTILVTSRARLNVTGELVVPVSPLSLPGRETRGESRETGRSLVARLSTLDSVRLFVERAQAVRPDFALTEANAGAVAEVCRRLDGLPLAIELAAARSDILGPSALLARLEQRLPLLTGGPRDAPDRHRTMRDAIAWSYDLLTPAEQAVFRGLAVFVGGFTLEAAEAVCGTGDDDDAIDPARDLLAIIESLTRQSLLRVTDRAAARGSGPRLGMLETVREFAAERLVASGDAAIRRRHAEYFLRLAARAEPTFWGDAPGDWRHAIEPEVANLRAALEWATEQGEADVALCLASTMFDPNWMTGDNAREQQRWTRRALAMSGGSPTNRVKALSSAAWLAHAHYDFEGGRALAEEAIALAERNEDAFGSAWARFVLGQAAFHEGDIDRARRLLEDALTALRGLDAPGRTAWVLCYLASLDSRDALDEGGDPAGLARAAGLYEEALAEFRAIGNVRGTARALHGLAYVAYKQRDLPRALSLTREVLALDWEHRWPVYHYLEDIADIAGRLGRPEFAARLYGAAHAQRERVGRPIEPVYRAEFEDDVAVARRALGEAAFVSAWAAGEALPPEQAVAEALDPALLSANEAEPARASTTESVVPGHRPAAKLTERQAEILPMLAAGMTDREIAAALFLSHRTIEHHVARLAARLGVKSRAAIVDAAHAAGFLRPDRRPPAG